MTITVYTKPACGPCIATKRALEKNGLAFDEKPAIDNLEMLQGLGHMQAPVVVVMDDDQAKVLGHWSGFELALIEALAA